jgi:hypothetical protein
MNIGFYFHAMIKTRPTCFNLLIAAKEEKVHLILKIIDFVELYSLTLGTLPKASVGLIGHLLGISPCKVAQSKVLLGCTHVAL